MTFVEEGEHLISFCRNWQALNVVELLCTSRYVVILYFGLAQKQPLGRAGHDRASRGLENGVVRRISTAAIQKAKANYFGFTGKYL